MAGGGALNKIFPGYKDKIWSKLPSFMQLHLINKWNDELLKKAYYNNVTLNNRVKSLNKYFLDKLKPSYVHRSTNIDYKKQRARGTLIEGVDYYCPGAENRLAKFFEPYNEEENMKRSRYKYQDLKKYILFAIGVTTVHGYLQSRPIAWCSDIQPPEPPYYPFWFKSPLHGHDIASVRRGYEVYRQICATCHSMEQMRFRRLINEVYPEKRVKEIAASYDVVDGPNSEGEMFTRPGVITDPFPNPYPNAEAARFANGGAMPPDLSVMASAKKRGPDYLFSLLTGYCEPPEGIKLRPGLYFNNYFPGGSISMPPPLEDGMIEYEDGTPATVSQMAKDVASFITWASDSTHDERKLTGFKMLVALSACTFFLAVWRRFYWSMYATSRMDFRKIKHIR